MTSVADFDFDLPDRLIAQDARPRGTSRLLVVDRASASWHEHTVAELPALLVPGDRLVANDTRVFPARLIGRRDPTGGAAECFLLERRSAREWLALVHPGQKLKPGARILFEDAARAPGIRIRAVVRERTGVGRRLVELEVERDGRRAAGDGLRAAGDGPRAARLPGDAGAEGTAARLSGSTDAEGQAARPHDGVAEGDIGGADAWGDVDDAIDRLGHVPLPPYINRLDDPADRERYQTVFARARGSVAAPTAGLHLTDAIIGAARQRGIGWTTVTHHVGYGTFKPVRVETVEAHAVDPESFDIAVDAADAIASTRRAGGRIVAVGTTTTRALESAGREDGRVGPGPGTTDLFIYPGYRFTVVDALMTNFHLPKSSLLMLVAAFAGRELILDAYRYAVAEQFRFYSYGDAMLIR